MSRQNLNQEFPGFAGTPPPAGGAPARVHPAKQLRAFLTRQGQEGWQLPAVGPAVLERVPARLEALERRLKMLPGDVVAAATGQCGSQEGAASLKGAGAVSRTRSRLRTIRLEGG